MADFVTVLGLGNILMSDEGVGVRVMEAVRELRDWPAEVRFVDGGAGGLNLLNVIEEAERLVVFDAADMRLAPGELRILTSDQLADTDDEHRLSLHDVSFAETLDLCRRFFRAPEVIRILAVQPKCLDRGLQLSPELAAALPSLARAGAELVGEVGDLRNCV
jgi:hydrogenase maturation protease